MRDSILKPIILATLLCGSLDILLAIALTLLKGRAPADMLRFVASGPFPDATGWGAWGSTLGLLVHFALMAVMVGAFVVFAQARPSLLERPLAAGLLYGLLTYAAMNLLVVPLRFPAAWPPTALSIGTQLFAHIVLVGVPTALIATHYLASMSTERPLAGQGVPIGAIEESSR